MTGAVASVVDRSLDWVPCDLKGKSGLDSVHSSLTSHAPVSSVMRMMMVVEAGTNETQDYFQLGVKRKF